MLRRSKFERLLILSAVLAFTGFAIAGYVAEQKKSGVASEATQATQAATQANIAAVVAR
jgi:hypothetical protein